MSEVPSHRQLWLPSKHQSVNILCFFNDMLMVLKTSPGLEYKLVCEYHKLSQLN